jgi:hypothetical protein
MMNDDYIEKIEPEVMVLGAVFAATLIGLIVWLAG